MRTILRHHRSLVATFLVLVIGLALGIVFGTDGEPATQVGRTEASALPADEAALEVAAGGPPSCLGYSLGDPCITPRALGQCRAAVAQCRDEPVQVILTCPLQFSCGK